MKATTSIDQTSITHNLAATGDTDGGGNPVQDKDTRTGKNTGNPESELRAAARRQGPQPQGTGSPHGRQLPIPVPGQQRAPALEPDDAGEGAGGAG